MAVALKSIIPQEIHCQIPVIIQDPQTGESIFDSITVYSPTLERIEAFHNEASSEQDSGVLLYHLIVNFTDLGVSKEDIPKLIDSTNYFSEVFDSLQFELYRILTTVVKQGFKTRELISQMDEEHLQNLEDAGVEQASLFKEIKKLSKKNG